VVGVMDVARPAVARDEPAPAAIAKRDRPPLGGRPHGGAPPYVERFAVASHQVADNATVAGYSAERLCRN